MLRKAHHQPNKNGLLPSVTKVENPDDPEMKRDAAQIEDTPDPQVKDKPKRPSDNREEITKIMMAQSRAIKRAALGPPFQSPTEMAKGPEMAKSRPKLGESSKAQGSCKQPVYDGALNLPPLSHDSIAAILKAAKPDCDKAKTWVDAHETTKVIQARMKAQEEGREELRKKVQRRLHARMVLSLPGGSSTNLQAMRVSDDEERYNKLSPMEKIQQAHERYQKALAKLLDL